MICIWEATRALGWLPFGPVVDTNRDECHKSLLYSHGHMVDKCRSGRWLHALCFPPFVMMWTNHRLRFLDRQNKAKERVRLHGHVKI